MPWPATPIGAKIRTQVAIAGKWGGALLYVN